MDHMFHFFQLYEEAHFGKLPPVVGEMLTNMALCYRKMDHIFHFFQLYEVLCPIAPLIYSRLSAMVGRSGWQITLCIASINSTAI